MNKIKLIIVLIIGVFLSGCSSCPIKPNPFPKNIGSIYQYNEPPEICFFPVNKAKWDGYKVTTKNWNQLTDYQKTQFITEGITDIETNAKVNIEVKDYWRLLISINTGVNMANIETPNEEVPMIKFLLESLKASGMVKESNPK